MKAATHSWCILPTSQDSTPTHGQDLLFAPSLDLARRNVDEAPGSIHRGQRAARVIPALTVQPVGLLQDIKGDPLCPDTGGLHIDPHHGSGPALWRCSTTGPQNPSRGQVTPAPPLATACRPPSATPCLPRDRGLLCSPRAAWALVRSSTPTPPATARRSAGEAHT